MQHNSTLGINNKIVRFFHQIMLITMFYSSCFATSQAMVADYFKAAKPVKYIGKSDYANAGSPAQDNGQPLSYITENNPATVQANKGTASNYGRSIVNSIGTVESDISEGFIGTSPEKPVDDARDNLFKLNLTEFPEEGIRAYLTYEAEGISSLTAVSTSINDQYALGGYLIKRQAGWNQHREEINPSWLRAGENRIMFSIPQHAGYNYRVRNVKLQLEKTETVNSSISLITQDINLTKDNKIYIRGFVRKYSSGLTVEAENVALSVNEDSFEGVLPISEEIRSRGFVVVRAADSHGFLGQEILMLNPLSEADILTPIESIAAPASASYYPGNASELSLSGAVLHVAENALEDKTKISITKLRTVDLAPLGSGMVNVTKGGTGYRFLPDGTKFRVPVKLELEYDNRLLPPGYNEKDIKTFYFNTRSKSWVAVDRDTIQLKPGTIVSYTNHFTDYINGVIQTPESPETAGFTPTAMTDIKAADPAAEITLINPPSASQNGDANIDYPIKIPAGRNGMQPSLTVHYSNEGPNGWLGQGWSIDISAITIDTRWGTPLFDSQNESEIYALNGENLMYPNLNGANWMPNRHYDVEGATSTVYSTQSRPRINNAVFTPRKQGSFARIERIGNSVSTYYWKVTTTTGTVHWYGGDQNGINENTVIRNANQAIVHWGLCMTEDIHKNNVIYEYRNQQIPTQSGLNANLNGGKVFNIERIYYTGTAGKKGPYLIRFESKTQREDVSINGRLGIKQVDPYFLDNIKVGKTIAPTSHIRNYAFKLGYGKFKKGRLVSVAELNKEDIEFYKHTFEYYDDLAVDGVDVYFGSWVNQTICNDAPEPACPDNDNDGVCNDQDQCPDQAGPASNNGCPELCRQVAFMTPNEQVYFYNSSIAGLGHAVQTTDCFVHSAQLLGYRKNGLLVNAYTDNILVVHGDNTNPTVSRCPVPNVPATPTYNHIIKNPYGEAKFLQFQSNFFSNSNLTTFNAAYIYDAYYYSYLNTPTNEPMVLSTSTLKPSFYCTSNMDLNIIFRWGQLSGSSINWSTYEAPFLKTPSSFNVVSTVYVNNSSTPIGSYGFNEAASAIFLQSALASAYPGTTVNVVAGTGTNPSLIHINTTNPGLNSIRVVLNLYGQPFQTNTYNFNNCNAGRPTAANSESVAKIPDEILQRAVYKYQAEGKELSLPIEMNYLMSFGDDAKTENYVLNETENSHQWLDTGNVPLKDADIITKLDQRCNIIAGKNSSFFTHYKAQETALREERQRFAAAWLLKNNNAPEIANPTAGGQSMAGPTGGQGTSGINGNNFFQQLQNNFVISYNSSVTGNPDCPTFTNSLFLIPGSIPSFNSAGALLGSTVSKNVNLGGHLGFGVDFSWDPTSKNITVGGGYNHSWDNSESLTSLIDINGDGQNDIVFKSFGGLYWKKHIVTRTYDSNNQPLITHSFAAAAPILSLQNKITDFYRSYGDSSSWNLQVNFGFSGAGAFAGYESSTNNSTNNVYFTDANGDGLMDIVRSGIVYFNRINSSGNPYFEPQSLDTENMLIVAAPVTVTPPPVEQEVSTPNYDVVKVWEAPADGTIRIENSVVNTDPQTEAIITVEMEKQDADNGCGGTITPAGGNGVYTYAIDAGNATGQICINYNAFTVPDKFDLTWNGQTVTSGYRGVSSYNNELINAGVNPADINTTAGGNGQGQLCINKTSAEPTVIQVVVTGPLGGTAWSLTSNCPGETLRVVPQAQEPFIERKQSFSLSLPVSEILGSNPASIKINGKALGNTTTSYKVIENFKADFEKIYSESGITVSGNQVGIKITESYLNFETISIEHPDKDAVTHAFVAVSKPAEQHNAVTPSLAGRINATTCTYVPSAMCLLYGAKLNSATPTVSSTITDASTQCNPGGGLLRVKKGDRIYFRTHSVAAGNPAVVWDPKITYTSTAMQAVTDQNGLPPYVSSYSDGFILSKNAPITFPGTGTAQITWDNLSVVAPTDAVIFEVIKRSVVNGSVTNSTIFTKTCNPNVTTAVVPTGLNAISVTGSGASQATQFIFRVRSTSNVNWKAIDWRPRMICTTVQPVVPTQNGPSEGDVTVAETKYPAVDYSIYSHYLCGKAYTTVVVPASGQQITPSVSGLFTSSDNGVLYFVVKRGNAYLGRKTITVTNGSVQMTPSGALSLSSGTGPIEVGFYTDDSSRAINSPSDISLLRRLVNASVVATFTGTATTTIGWDKVNLLHKQIGIFGPMYRGWGQFMYNAAAATGALPAGNLGVNLLKEELLTITDAQATALHDALLDGNHNVNSAVSGLQNIDINSPGGPAQMQAALQNISNNAGINNMPFLIANPYRDLENGIYLEKWIGLHNQCYSNAGGARAAKLSQAFSFQEEESVTQGALNTGAYGIDKRSNGRGNSASGGGSFGGFGASGTSSLGGISHSVTDYIDLNGDRYPDIVTTGQVQYTLKTGGLFNPVTRGGYGGDMSTDTNGSWGFSASGTFGKSGKPNPGAEGAKIPANGKLKIGKPGTSSYGGGNNSTSISGNFGQGDNNTSRIWGDVNGDGLADIISKSGSTITVHLNFGNTAFNANNYWGNFEIGKGKSTTFGGGLGYNYANASIEAGISLGRTDSDTENTLIDINGDGLLDKVSSTNSNITVDFNRGNKFIGSPVTMNSFSLYNSATTVNSGLNGTGTYAMIWPLYLIFVVIPLKIPDVSVTAAGGTSTNRTKKSVIDFDGDGYPDIVEEINASTVKISHSRIRRTDMLKKVTNPLGGTFTIDYEVMPVDYNNPDAKWVMKSLAVNDGYDKVNDGEDIYRKEFKYEKGRYDRRERDFYGYETVQTIDYTYDANGDQGLPYRTSVSVYHNNSYFLKGLLKENYVVKGTDPSAKFYRTVNTYQVRKLDASNDQILNNSILPETFDVGGREGRRTAAVVLVKAVKEYYELEATPQLISEVDFKYDNKGRIVSYTSLGNINDPGDDYTTEISYHNLSNNIISVPKEMRVLVNSTEKRRRVTDVDPATGKVLEIRAYLTSSQYAKTSMQYDTYGNLTYIEYPQNDNNQAMAYKYTYDSGFNKYVTNIADSFGYSSSAEYDSDYDKVLKTIDMAGNEMRYNYDGFGRTFLILAPKEAEAGKRYTIMFSYYPVYSSYLSGYGLNEDNFVPVAVTQHYDMQHPNDDIETISFVDGLGRPIQVKKDITLNKDTSHQNPDYYEAMAVSGKQYYDLYGRPSQIFHPYFESKTLTTKLVLNEYESTYEPTISGYDELDRVVHTTDSDGATTSSQYSIDSNPNGITGFKVRSSADQNGSQSVVAETYNNVYGKTVSTMNEGPNGQIWTNYKFNAINELLEYRDAESIVTYYEYDNLGRKLLIKNPDAGTTTFKYDLAGNLRHLQTSNLATNGTSINYEYYYNRLQHVEYPLNSDGSENISNVTYKYGTSGNETGRLVYQQDATGEQSFKYGNMGEIVFNQRIVVGPTPSMPVRVFDSYFNYDSFNRIQSMIYPDGEKVLYSYDAGGNLNRMTGELNGSPYHYIDRLDYDFYQQKAYLLYGNKTETYYEYTPTMRRLNNLNVKTSDGQDLFNNFYDYDLVGNVTALGNTAGVTANNMAGTYNHKFQYDTLNRLVHADGQFTGSNVQQEFNNDYYSDYKTDMEYNNTHGFVKKIQYHYKNDSTNAANTYDNAYFYNDGTHQVNKIVDGNTGESEGFKYDLNGNMVAKYDSQNTREMYWDESNRLRVVYDSNGSGSAMQHYIYDAAGERVLKANSDIAQTFQNGTLVDPPVVTVNNYTTYASAYLVVDGYGIYSKHYFAGSQRIVSRIGDQPGDIFNNASGRPVSGDGNNKALQQQQVKDLNLMLEKAKLGKARFRDYKEYKFEEIQQESEIENQQLLSANKPDGISLSPSAAPPPTALYFYHPDHLGTSTALTDSNGAAYQFFLNLPFGETMAEQLPTTYYRTPYKFNAKELDEETGLYYYGARYYDPKASLWFSTDPMMEKYPGVNPYIYCMQNPIKFVDLDGKEPTPNWSAFISNINNLVANGLSGKGTLDRGCNMCCLNALASNLNALYGSKINIPTNDKFVTAVEALDAKLRQRMQDVTPTYQGSTLSTRSHNNMNSDTLAKDYKNIDTNIGATLNSMTGDGTIGVYAVGLGMQYHSTMVVVSKDPTNKINVDGVEYSGTNENPLFIFVEDFGGARVFTQEQFSENMSVWIYSARKHYRHEGKDQDGKNPKKDNPLDTVIYQLKIEEVKEEE